MRYRMVIVIALTALSSILTACGGPAANTTNVNVARTDTNNPVVPTPPTNDAPTLTPVFKAYCEAWVKNDEAGLRKVYSSATIKTFESQMKEEKAKSLIKFLEATDKVSGNPCEASDEQIMGDKAIATIRSNKYPRGIKVEFVKENGEWKLTNNAPTLSTVGAGANSNSGSTAK